MKIVPIITLSLVAVMLLVVAISIYKGPTSELVAQVSSSTGSTPTSLYLNKSDVLFSPRTLKPGWQENYSAFGANRIVWSYSGIELNKNFGIPAQCALPTRIPADGSVTTVDMSSDPNRVIVMWSNQSTWTDKFIPVGTRVTVGANSYVTVANSTVGNLNLPRTAVANVGDLVFITRTTSTPNLTRPADGTISTVTTSDPNRTIATWSNQSNAAFKFIAAGTPVTVGTTTYLTVADTTVGNLNLPKNAVITTGANVYILTVASNPGIACIRRNGETIAPYGSKEPSADINSPAFRAYLLKNAQIQLDNGCRMFHQDEPDMNWYQVTATSPSDGGGCFGDDSMTGFNKYLKERLSPSKLTTLGITNIDTFNYRTASSEVQKNTTLKTHFEDFQKKSVIDFQNWLHRSLSRYAEVRYSGAQVSFSGNFGVGAGTVGFHDWLSPSFNFNLGELYPTRQNGLELTRRMATLTRAQFRNPGGITIGTSDTWLNQRVVATAYTLGLTTIAPWDVYIPNSSRYSATPSDFTPLFSMIRSNKSVFDDYTFLTDSITASEISAIPTAPATGEVNPDGYVTRFDTTTSPGKLAVFWTNQLDSNFRNITAGDAVIIGTTTYNVISNATGGNIYLPLGTKVNVGDPVKLKPSAATKVNLLSSAKATGTGSYYVAASKHNTDNNKKAVHVVNWGTTNPAPTTLTLKASDFPTAPSFIVTHSNPTPVAITPTVSGEYLIYNLGDVNIWSYIY